jgi:hypothetical protein
MPLRKMQNTIYPCKHLFTASYLAVFLPLFPHQLAEFCFIPQVAH